MRVDLFLILPLVQILEFHLYVRGTLLVGIGALVLREADGERTPGNLLFEQVLFIQEQYDRRFNEPFAIANRVEQLHRLYHPIHLLVLRQYQVIAAQSDAEDDRGNALETVYPFFSFRPLTANIEHFKM